MLRAKVVGEVAERYTMGKRISARRLGEIGRHTNCAVVLKVIVFVVVNT